MLITFNYTMLSKEIFFFSKNALKDSEKKKHNVLGVFLIKISQKHIKEESNRKHCI